MAMGVRPVQAGPVRSTLFEAFCTQLGQVEKIGCNGYLQYRIKEGLEREFSLKSCYWGCTQILSNAAEVERCQSGCAFVHSKDN
ncbi:MAG: hypothetical protein AB7D07_00380 [Desulfovibrionaceae bacterium]